MYKRQGGDGAPKIVAELQRRGIELFLVCDEGGGIITEPIGGYGQVSCRAGPAVAGNTAGPVL